MPLHCLDICPIYISDWSYNIRVCPAKVRELPHTHIRALYTWQSDFQGTSVVLQWSAPFPQSFHSLWFVEANYVPETPPLFHHMVEGEQWANVPINLHLSEQV